MLTSTLDGGEWSASRPCHLTPGKIAGIQGLVGLRACLDFNGKQKILLYLPEIETRLLGQARSFVAIMTELSRIPITAISWWSIRITYCLGHGSISSSRPLSVPHCYPPHSGIHPETHNGDIANLITADAHFIYLTVYKRICQQKFGRNAWREVSAWKT
jgi:hypothetical protein